MADRFPSLEDFDAGQTEAQPSGGDFQERERALLGEDADLFQSGGAPQGATVEDGDDDLLGGDFQAAPSGPGDQDEINGFESAFPALDTDNAQVGPGGTITDSSAPFQGSNINNSTGGYTNYNAPPSEADSEPIRQWRSKRDADLSKRDEASSRKKNETVETAQRDIDSFYENYNRKIDKQKSQVQKEAEEFLAKREDTTAGGTSWERIAKLVDLSGKGQIGGGNESTKKRMRDMLLSLKADKDAPGATGI